MDIPLRVLIIEDSDRDLALEVRALKAAGYEVTYAVADTAAAMEAALNKQAFDIVISDNDMPQFDAQGALAVLKQSGLDIPFIIVSGSIGEEIAVALMRAGAHDYIMKDKLARLVPAVQRELKEAESRHQRKRAKEALRESEERYKALFDRSLDLVYINDFEGRFIDANDTALNRLGYNKEEILSLNFATLLSEDQMPLVLQTMQEIMDIGYQKNVIELRLKTKNGNDLFVETLGSVILHEGIPSAVLGIARDITERKRAEDVLRESEIRYRELVENMGSGVSVYETLNNGEDFVFKEYNTAAEMIDKTPRGQAIGRSVVDVFPGVKDFGLFDVFQRVYRTGKSERHPVTFYKDEKMSGWRENYVYKLPSGEIVAVFEDVTERKEAEGQLEHTLESLRKAFGATIQVMVSSVETRDPYTAGHQVRSADIARAIATEMGLSQEKIEGIRMAGSIHDIGKLSIPAEILSKPAKLSEIEYSLVKEHARKGYEILKDVESPWPLAQIVYQHHERMDGSGYPRKLKGDDILMEARIMAVADVVESMSSHRPYRPALGIDKALDEITKNRGVLYDSQVVDACLTLFQKKRFLF